MADSDPNAVAEIAGVSGCTEDVARRWLKVKNNDADAALNAIFDCENLEKAEQTSTWNESEFSADRDGNATFGPQNYSHNEQNLHPLGQSAAPTRGNSPAPSLMQPAHRDDEDAELQKAIVASQQDQPGGAVSNANFKPATRGYYDAANWSMTTFGVESQQASEIIPDLEPHDRKNEPGEPLFLKQLPSGDYLPNLLTIAHSIPMARRALLAPHKSYSSYGTDTEWWKGHGIRLPKIVSTVSGAPLEPATTERDEILAEMQRLMALLDESSRCYGSADTLVRLAEPINGSILDKVLQVWESASLDTIPEGSGNSESFVFHSLIGTTHPEGVSAPNMWTLPLSVSSGSEVAKVDLALIMDDTLWDTDADESTFHDNFMVHCAHVLPIRLTQINSSNNTLGVVIPPAFYVDKYLQENVDATREVRKQVAHGKKKIDRIENAQLKLNNYRHAQKGNLDTSLLMKHAISYFSGESRKTLIEEREGAGAGGETEIPPPLEHHHVIAEQLNTVYKEIKSKLEALNQKKEKVRKALDQLSQETGLAQTSLKHRYSLRGVSTKPHVTYLLRPRDPSDNDMIYDEEAPEGMQWWRIEYDVQLNGAKVIKTKSTQDDVIRAAELEHNQALLVYASDSAISNEHTIELTPALREFIKNDDENLTAELQMNGFGHVNVYPAFERVSHNRRGSGDSTIANFDNDEDPPGYEPPRYDENLEYGRIPIDMDDSKDMAMNNSPPAHEIRLEEDDQVQHMEKGVEMIEKVHPLFNSSKVVKPEGDHTMIGIKVQGEEDDLIDFRD